MSTGVGSVQTIGQDRLPGRGQSINGSEVSRLSVAIHSAWFNMKLRTPGGESSKVCRFTDIYQGPSIIGGNYWQYTAELEIYDRAIALPPPWGQFPDFISGMDIIDIALNREWPAA